MTNHVPGTPAKVEVYNYKLKDSELLDCYITGIQTATDREYRVNVKLSTGKEIHNCAPECVKPVLRSVKVTFENGDIINTNMAASLTDKEITDYYAIGKSFNLGSVSDNMQKITKCEIIL